MYPSQTSLCVVYFGQIPHSELGDKFTSIAHIYTRLLRKSQDIIHNDFDASDFCYDLSRFLMKS